MEITTESVIKALVRTKKVCEKDVNYLLEQAKQLNLSVRMVDIHADNKYRDLVSLQYSFASSFVSVSMDSIKNDAFNIAKAENNKELTLANQYTLVSVNRVRNEFKLIQVEDNKFNPLRKFLRLSDGSFFRIKSFNNGNCIYKCSSLETFEKVYNVLFHCNSETQKVVDIIGEKEIKNARVAYKNNDLSLYMHELIQKTEAKNIYLNRNKIKEALRIL